MSAHLIGLFAIGFFCAPILWLFVPDWKSRKQREHERIFWRKYGGQPPSSQPRTKEEASRWRAGFEERKRSGS